jgi:hypothetical protein
MLRRAGLLTHREARDLERSTVAVRTITVFYAGLAMTGTMLVVLALGFGSGIYYATHFGSEPPQPPGPAENVALSVVANTPDVHEAYRARMDRLLQELEVVSDQQKALEAKLTNKTTEAAEMASQAQLLRAQLRIKEREIQTLSAKPEFEPGRKFVTGQTRYLQAEASLGSSSSGKVQDKLAMAASSAPAEILIDINPPDARPGNPYRLRLEIHNRGETSINVTDLELVWNYAGRNTGGPIGIGKRLVGPRSTSVLYEVDGIWLEELAAGTIVATVTLEGGLRLVNSLRWNDG